MKYRRYKTPPKVPSSIWKNPVHFIAFGFGSGALPYAPGTWGTLVAVPLYYLLASFSLPVYLIVTVLATLASIWICDKVSRDINVQDHQGMCLDEIIGFLVTMIAVPRDIKWIIVGFLLFRLFDIWKPYPIRYIDEKVHGGFGMIFDDVLAGVYACVIVHILMLL